MTNPAIRAPPHRPPAWGNMGPAMTETPRPDHVSARLASGGGSPDYARQFNPPWTLDPARTALVVVDMQYASASRREGLGRLLKDREQETSGAYRFERIETVVVPTIQALLAFFRERGLRVVYLTVGSEMPDFSDLLPHMQTIADESRPPDAHTPSGTSAIRCSRTASCRSQSMNSVRSSSSLMTCSR